MNNTQQTTVYGKAAFAGFANALGTQLGVTVKLADGASPCIDRTGTIMLPNMDRFQTAAQFDATCSSLIHEMAHLYYSTHQQIDATRTALEHDCFNAVVDVADETWISREFIARANNARPGQLLTESNYNAAANYKQYSDWSNPARFAWNILCSGIFYARAGSSRYAKWLRRKSICEARKHGADIKRVYPLLRAARLSFSKKTSTFAPTSPTVKRWAKYRKIAAEIATILAPFAAKHQQQVAAPGAGLQAAMGAGSQSMPAGAVEATAAQGAAATQSPAAPGGSGAGGGAATPAPATNFCEASYNAIRPAVQTVADRIANDGEGVYRVNGLSRGVSIVEPHRVYTDGAAMGRWQLVDNADGIAVAVVLDCSGSMRNRLTTCAGIARAFATSMRNAGPVQSFKFGDHACKSDDDFANISTMGCTNTAAALNLASKWLAPQSTGKRWIVLITDGNPDDSVAANCAAAAAAARGCKLLVVGLDVQPNIVADFTATAADVDHLAVELQLAASRLEQMN